MTRVEEAVSELVEAGLLTERQAEAWVLRDVEAVPRQAAAASMGISASTLDNYRRAAEQKVEAARETIGAVEEARGFAPGDIADSCAECGDGIGGRFVIADDRVLCPRCGDVPESAF